MCHYHCPSHVVVTHLILRKLHQCVSLPLSLACGRYSSYSWKAAPVCHYRCPSHVFVTHLILGKLHQCATTVVPRMCSLLILFLESCTSVSLPLSLACGRYSSYSWKAAPVCHYRCPSHVVVTHLILGKLHQCATTVVPRMCSLLILFLESCTSAPLPLSLACVRYSSYSWKAAPVCHYRCPSHVFVTHLILRKLHQCVTTVVPRMCSLLILFLESCTSVCHYRCPSHVVVTHLILGKLHQCVSLPLSLACGRYSSYS